MRFLFALAFLLFAFPAFADDPQVIQGVNLVPEVCGRFYSELKSCPSWLTFDREAEEKKTVHERQFETTCVVINPPIQEIQWGDWLSSSIFQQEARKKFDSLSDEGEIYGGTYLAAKKTSMALYGDTQQVRDVYITSPKNDSSKLKGNEIFLLDDDTGLARIFNNIHANSLFQFGARGYPFISEPNHISIYEIDADTSGPNSAQPVFSSRLVCEYRTANYTTTLNSPPTPVPGAETTYSNTGAPPTPAPSPAPAASDSCTPFKDSNPAYYASCEDRQKRVQRMMDAKDSMH